METIGKYLSCVNVVRVRDLPSGCVKLPKGA